MSDQLAARRAALAALTAVEERDAWSNLAVPAAISGLDDERDRGFAAHLAYETLRWQGTLDHVLSLVLTRDLSEVEAPLRRVLRLGATQLLVSDVPDRAAVDTSVRLAREAVPEGRARGAAGFVNGVLRALARRGDDLGYPDPGTDLVGHLALRSAHPRWIVEDLLDRYGAERAAAILDADDVAPGLTLRAVGDVDELLAELRAAGVEASRGTVPGALRAPGVDPRQLPAVREGRAVVQDEASMRVGLATGTTPGDRALDLCAAPGGKATHLAALGARVTAVELHAHRARMIEEAAARTGADIEVLVGDGRRPPLADDARFERVLVDAPCTGLGTGRRRPEVRWRRTPAQARTLAGLQAELLTAGAQRVAPGGRLVYAVCTWTAAETVEVADAFTDPRFTRRTQVQLLPDADDTDGMFLAVWDHTG